MKIVKGAHMIGTYILNFKNLGCIVNRGSLVPKS
jgi:hypothetical protein